MTNYKCIKCNKKIPRKEIPKEFFEKIGTQIIWHEDCLTNEEKGFWKGFPF